jgi:DNA gyrase subunit A
LIERFELSEKQAQSILEMRLQRLTGLEREKIEEEYNELLKLMAYLKEVLEKEELVLKVIKEELMEIKNKYGDERRTEIQRKNDEIDSSTLSRSRRLL